MTDSCHDERVRAAEAVRSALESLPRLPGPTGIGTELVRIPPTAAVLEHRPPAAAPPPKLPNPPAGMLTRPPRPTR